MHDASFGRYRDASASILETLEPFTLNETIAVLDLALAETRLQVAQNLWIADQSGKQDRHQNVLDKGIH